MMTQSRRAVDKPIISQELGDQLFEFLFDNKEILQETDELQDPDKLRESLAAVECLKSFQRRQIANEQIPEESRTFEIESVQITAPISIDLSVQLIAEMVLEMLPKLEGEEKQEAQKMLHDFVNEVNASYKMVERQAPFSADFMPLLSEKGHQAIKDVSNATLNPEPINHAILELRAYSLVDLLDDAKKDDIDNTVSAVVGILNDIQAHQTQETSAFPALKKADSVVSDVTKIRSVIMPSHLKASIDAVKAQFLTAYDLLGAKPPERLQSGRQLDG